MTAFTLVYSLRCDCIWIVSVVEEMKIKYLTFDTHKWLSVTLMAHQWPSVQRPSHHAAILSSLSHNCEAFKSSPNSFNVFCS